MFQRQAREPFPIRNIIILALIIIGFFVYLLSQSKKAEKPAIPAPVENGE